MTHSDTIPAGFRIMAMAKGFHELLGPMYETEVAGRLVLAFKVIDKHMNPFGGLHGGVLAALADFQIVPAAYLMGIEATNCRTVSLTTDFLAPGNLGDWVELHVVLQKHTRSMVFTRAEMTIGREAIARTTGIYRIVVGRA